MSATNLFVPHRYADAIQQADTVTELGLLSTLPTPLPPGPAKTRLFFGFTKSDIIILRLTQLPVAHPEVLERHGVLPEDACLWCIMGGSNLRGSASRGSTPNRSASRGSTHNGSASQDEWNPIPLAIGRCIRRGDTLEWIPEEKHAQKPMVTQFKLAKNTISLSYTTYRQKSVVIKDAKWTPATFSVRGQRGFGRIEPETPPATSKPASSIVRWMRNLVFTPEPDRHITLWLFVNTQWHVFTGAVHGPLSEGDSTDLSPEGKLTATRVTAIISDTSGRSMWFPVEWKLFLDDKKPLTVKADFESAVAYLPSGNMNWFGPVTITDEKDAPYARGVIEAHQFQSSDELISTTLQLAGFIDRRDDDTRNDWILFRPRH